MQIDQSPMRILVVRPDRVGDVILSTPVLEAIHQHYPASELTVMVKSQIAPLVKGLPGVSSVFLFDPDGVHSGLRGLVRLIKEIKAQNFRVAVTLQSYWKISLAIFVARVRYRLGPLSKLHSYLFFNRGIRQSRSLVEMHETDYGLQLLRRLGIRSETRKLSVKAYLSEEDKSDAKAWLAAKGFDPARPLIVVHPGMGGSALNWPELHYIELVRALVGEGRQVLVTGGPTEGPLLRRVKEALGSVSVRVWFYGGDESREMGFLAGLFSFATVVVAPSTGPMHLAVALGSRVVTFYPPIRVQSAIRWGPYLKDESRASVLVPEVYCGEDFKCRGTLCNYFPCMKSMTVPQALTEVHRHIEASEKPSGEKSK